MTKYQISKIQDGGRRHFENSFIAISQPEIIRFQRNLVSRCRLCFQGRLLNNILKFCKFKNGGRPPYWKLSFGYISTSDYRINAKFCRIKQNHVLTQDTWPKYQISKIQDGGRPPCWIWFYRYNSAGNHPISAQFSVLAQIALPRTATWQSGRILQIQHGRRPPSWKSFFGYIWTIYFLINAKFRTKEHNYAQTEITWPKYSGSRCLNRDNKTANINVKKL